MVARGEPRDLSVTRSPRTCRTWSRREAYRGVAAKRLLAVCGAMMKVWRVTSPAASFPNWVPPMLTVKRKPLDELR
jgi:hypothetical protein